MFGAAAALAANTSNVQKANLGSSAITPSPSIKPAGQNAPAKAVQPSLAPSSTPVRINAANQVQAQNQVKVLKAVERAGTPTQLVESLLYENLRLREELNALPDKEKKVYQNQNKVREAAHVLLAAEDLTGGIGQQVATIAREFNNSVEKTIRAENKIQERGWLKRLLVGSDKDAVNEIEREVKMNQGKVQQLLSLQEKCACSDSVKAIIKAEIQKVSEEQTRLENLSKEEKKAEGVWGWFKGIFTKDKEV